MEFTIDRKKWLRGTGVGSLDGLDGCRDVMGHYLLAIGFREEELAGKYNPREVKGAPYWLIDDNGGRYSSELSSQIMRVNDAMEMGERAREEELQRLFKLVGIEVKFEG